MTCVNQTVSIILLCNWINTQNGGDYQTGQKYKI